MKKRIKRILFTILLVVLVIWWVKLHKTLHDPNTILWSIYKFKQGYDHKNDYDLSWVVWFETLFSVPDASIYGKNTRKLKDFNSSKFDKVYKYDGIIYGLYNDDWPCYQFDDYWNLKCEFTQVDWLQEWVWYCYLGDWSIEYVFNYKAWRKDWVTIEYDLDGDVRTVEYYKDWKNDWEYIQRDYFDWSILNGYYVDDQRVGTWTWYNPDGSVNYLTQYKSWMEVSYKQYYDYDLRQLEYVALYDENGKKLENVWYYENGKIKKIETFWDSKYWYGVVKSEYYDENGNKLDKDPDSWWD